MINMGGIISSQLKWKELAARFSRSIQILLRQINKHNYQTKCGDNQIENTVMIWVAFRGQEEIELNLKLDIRINTFAVDTNKVRG